MLRIQHRLLVELLCVLAFAQSMATAGSATAHDVWIISSRRASLEGQHARLEYWRRTESASWTASSHEEFLSSDLPGVTTCVYVHGNRITHREAVSDGQRVHRQLTSCLDPHAPFRFVIWSWPSAQIEGPLEDVRYKACVSDAHARYLAWLVDQIPADAPVNLIGYSYGARLVSGSLHLLGGGRLAGYTLAHRLHSVRLPVRAALLAGALDSHALLPHGRHHLALSQVQRMLVLVNPRDPVLHHYPLLAGLLHKGPPAMGYTGFFTHSLGSESGKIAQWNVSGHVGGEHDWQRYLYSSAIVARLRGYVLPAGPPLRMLDVSAASAGAGPVDLSRQ